MRLNLSEIRANAMNFSAEWQGVTSERAEAQSFWNDFFSVFGIPRRSVASFEEKVAKLSGAYGRIDVFYAGKMLGEHKSAGEDLSKAKSQAFQYVQDLTRDGRTSEIPRYIVISDFARFVLFDLEDNESSVPIVEFPLGKLHEHIQWFGFLSGYEAKPVDPDDPINVRAVEVLGKLHDALEAGGYAGPNLEKFLVRILFCLFADDTSIFEAESFRLIIEQTHADGSDLGRTLAELFSVLNTPLDERSSNLPQEWLALPFVNGALFADDLGFASFNRPMRGAILECCDFDWSRISPAVFGSLFQSIMKGDERRQFGAHYTSERDIMKVVRSLFLDELQAELKKVRQSATKLKKYQQKLAAIKLLDPACGCGNFLVVSYREL